MSDTIRVAIIGGSLAGCTLANGLQACGHPRIAYEVYEAKPEFNERGAAVGLATNSTNALRSMGLDADQMFTAAGASTGAATRCLVGHGPHRGETMFQLPGGENILTRTRWLDELLERLPKEKLHSNKKLSKVTEPGSNSGQNLYTLHFEDGSTTQAHAVIGCDGAYSKIREIILGHEHKQLWKPDFGGYWDARGKLTPQQAADSFGTQLFDPTKPNNVCLVGEGAFMLFQPNEDGSMYHVIMSAIAGSKFDRSSWRTSLNREALEEQYSHWDKQLRTGVIDCLMSENLGPGMVFAQWDSREAPTYCRDGFCMIGDAAHAPLPWMGQGAGMTNEDAAVLTALLAAVQSAAEIPAALKAFDRARCESGRPQYIVTQSREAAKLLTGQWGLDPAALAHLDAGKWWTDVWNFDVQAHVREAVKDFESRKGM